MKNIIKLTGLSFLILSFAVLNSCKNKEVAPTIVITNPSNGTEIQKGANIIISTDVGDEDGSVTEVRFYIDGIGKASVSDFPYNYEWNTADATLGSHIISGTVYDNDGNHQSEEINITIVGNGPKTDFTVSSTNILINETVIFNDKSANNPISWSWDFGDGSKSTLQNPSHTYVLIGTFTVSLTVTNSFGINTISKTNYIAVNPPPIAPVADFICSPTTEVLGKKVYFTDLSINYPTSWRWETGDGKISFLQNTYVIYPTVGTYTISLTATNSFGSDTKTKVGYIHIDVNKTISFNPNLTYGSVTDVEGNTYKTILIGSQTWMAENLKTTKLNDNTSITLVTTSWENTYTSAYCWYYNNSSAYKDVFGALYNWYAVNTGKLCPVGWHVSTDDEWKQLEMFLGMSKTTADGINWRGNIESLRLKETGTTHWTSADNEGTNESGFTALPGGVRMSDGSYNGISTEASWWTSSEYSTDRAWFRMLSSVTLAIRRYNEYPKLDGMSVRCIKDN
jgi:uncharacterized protein (TIGR02145 family)